MKKIDSKETYSLNNILNELNENKNNQKESFSFSRAFNNLKQKVSNLFKKSSKSQETYERDSNAIPCPASSKSSSETSSKKSFSVLENGTSNSGITTGFNISMLEVERDDLQKDIEGKKEELKKLNEVKHPETIKQRISLENEIGRLEMLFSSKRSLIHYFTTRSTQ